MDATSLPSRFARLLRGAGGVLRVRFGLVWLAYALTAAAVVAAALLVGAERGRERAQAAIEERTRHTALLNAALLRTVLEKQRSLPFVLAQDSEVRQALATRDVAALQALSRRFELLAQDTRASVIYLLDAKGLTVAASNWREPVSFVGNDYGFRPYFIDALARGSAEYYALGTASRIPGLYITRRIEGPEGAPGVVVVKVQFDQVEADWRSGPDITYVSDTRGVIVVSKQPEWRFRTVAAIPEADKGPIRESLQFGDAPLTQVPVTPATAAGSPDIVTVASEVAPASRFVRISVPVPSTRWTLHQLAPADAEVRAAVREGRLGAVAVVVPLIALVGWLIHRRNRNLQRAAQDEASRIELERRVRDRTRELSAANDRLQSEVVQRQEAVTRLQEMREELAQANRLAIIGQVSAGIAHEINQPMAAIRSYADNAQILLRRESTGAVRENLATIAALTERISTIVEDLRAFARKRTGGLSATVVAESIDGALLLLHNRLRQQGVEMVCNRPPDDLKVVGNRVRLEQVLVNLMQNAIEAMEGRPGSRLELDWRVACDEVLLSVADNGPGIDEAVMGRLFTPFTTTKQSGLGLGHVICNDIITAFGGTLDVETAPGRGTRFTIHLKRAGPTRVDRRQGAAQEGSAEEGADVS